VDGDRGRKVQASRGHGPPIERALVVEKHAKLASGQRCSGSLRAGQRLSAPLEDEVIERASRAGAFEPHQPVRILVDLRDGPVVTGTADLGRGLGAVLGDPASSACGHVLVSDGAAGQGRGRAQERTD